MSTYIFDFDGTLVDSMSQWSNKMIEILDDNNIEYPDNIISILTPLGDKAAAEYLIGMGVKLTVDEVLKTMYDYAIHEYTFNIPAKPQVIETLQILKDKGHSLNILTASPHTMLDPCLKRLGIFDIFDNVWSCDDFGTTKADPKIYGSVAKKLNSDICECIFLDDNINALKTAKYAGMKIIGVYDSFSENDTEEIKEISDFYIKSFEELL